MKAADSQWLDAMYNNRARVPETPAILQGWAEQSAAEDGHHRTVHGQPGASVRAAHLHGAGGGEHGVCHGIMHRQRHLRSGSPRSRPRACCVVDREAADAASPENFTYKYSSSLEATAAPTCARTVGAAR